MKKPMLQQIKNQNLANHLNKYKLETNLAYSFL